MVKRQEHILFKGKNPMTNNFMKMYKTTEI